MSKHTPGPWRVYFHEDYPGQMQIGAGEIGGSGDEFDEWCIAATFGAADGTENGEANASLIAAAPELLEALRAQEEASDFATTISATVDDGGTVPKYLMDKADQLFARAERLRRSAIAKAEGR